MPRLTAAEIKAVELWDSPEQLSLSIIPKDQRLDDFSTGYILLYFKIGILRRSEVAEYRFTFNRDGRVQGHHRNHGKAFLRPDSSPLVINKAILIRGDSSYRDKKERSSYDLDSIHLHPGYVSWIRRTIALIDLKQGSNLRGPTISTLKNP